MTCPTCCRDMPALTAHGTPRKFCQSACAARNTRARATKRDMYAEEVEHLLSFGTPIPAILKALGVTPSALSKALYREGRTDLANPIARYQWKMRRAQVAA